MFKYAIARTPGRSLMDGISQTPELGKPIYELAIEQHQGYVKALEQCGLEVVVLDANEDFPDSTFTEDVAICTREMAVITRPGADARRGEAKLDDLRDALKRFYGDNIYEITEPGIMDGGDVMMVGDHFYIGVSERTNQAGAEQLAGFLAKHGMTSEIVPVVGILHLKDDVTYLAGNDVVIAKEYENHPAFAKFNKLVADEDEYYAVNSLWINDKVIVPIGYPKIEAKIREAGYEVILVEMSEFRKITGSLTCLSLRF